MRRKGGRGRPRKRPSSSQMHCNKNTISKMRKDRRLGLAGPWSSPPWWVHLGDIFTFGRVLYYFTSFVCVCFDVYVRVMLKLVRSVVCVCSTSRVSLRCSRSRFSWRWLSCHRKTSLWPERECSQGSAWTCHKTCVCVDLHPYTQTWSHPYQKMNIYNAIQVCYLLLC